MTPEDVRSLYLETYLWTDKANGNTYFSSRIYVNGNLIGSLPFQYGNGRQDEYEAKIWLVEKALLRPSRDCLRIALDVMNVDFYRSHQFVTKGDCRKHGEPLDFELSPIN